MKKFKRIAAFLLSLTLLFALSATLVSATVNRITGTDKLESHPIKIGTTDTGATLTQIKLTKGSAYSLGETGLVNVIEVTPSKTLGLKVLNGGKTTWSQATMGASALAYNASHTDSTVIAAVNGDPWIVYHTDYDGDGKKETGESVKHVSVSRGLMIIEGEIWATTQIDDENNLARNDNVERGTPASIGPVFGVKSDGTAIVGTPVTYVTLKNTTQNGKELSVGGINRLPAPNSVILYNHRIGDESFAYSDAYEIYLECEDTAFRLTKAVTGKVVAIYESGDKTERAPITENTVVISARGKSIASIKDQYAIGDSVSISCSIINDSDNTMQTKAWAKVTEAIGSFFYLLKNGTTMGQPGNATNYPCSIIGLKKDGSVIITTTTPVIDGSRSACQMQNLPALCRELGYETAILFDGGGSTQMITLEGDGYVRRSATPDSKNSVREVISGIAVVYKGVDESPKNNEKFGTVAYESLGIVNDTPVLPDGVDYVASPSYSYKYYASIETVNGEKQENLLGMRDPAYNTSWTAEQKAASIHPAVLESAEVNENKALVLSGFAYVNGGQGDYCWSTDLKNWHICTDASLSEGDSESKKTAETNGALTAASTPNARFANLTADLSEYEGETVTVYFGVMAKGDASKMCHFLTVEGVNVPAPETEAPTETETETETVSETVSETETTEEVTTAATETPTEAPTESETAKEKESGCKSSLSGSIVLIVGLAALPLLRRRKE